jgi:hypothetical protein
MALLKDYAVQLRDLNNFPLRKGFLVRELGHLIYMKSVALNMRHAVQQIYGSCNCFLRSRTFRDLRRFVANNCRADVECY